jgi:methylthioribose-1-phosphate isomerase
MTTLDTIRPVEWADGKVRLIDQTALPHRLQTIDYSDWQEVVRAIRDMIVRGAPAIGCTAALGMALAARQIEANDRVGFLAQLQSAGATFKAARPTAVNLMWAVDRLLALAERTPGAVDDIRAALLTEARGMIEEDIAINRRLGAYGAELLPPRAHVLTHCNAGALATAGYGTALGVVRAAVEAGKAVEVFADETRPRLQGMKLTAWELQHDGIPVTTIADNMAAVLMRGKRVDCVVVGADRIAANGDTANKIGTYSLAIQARFHGIPFYVAAPLSTIDWSLSDGSHIPIEERAAEEVTSVEGIRVAPEAVAVWNPAFDVTVAELITAIITEAGVARPPYLASLAKLRSEAQFQKIF